MSEWKISRRGGVCSACQRAFTDGERHISTLDLTPEGLARNEVCSAWWNARPEEATDPACRTACAERPALDPAIREPVFWWFTRHTVEPRRTLRLDLESLERLFLELEGREEPRLLELRYVLCLLLMRKRRVRLTSVERGPAGESFLVQRPRHEGTMRVFVFDFSPERMDEIRAELQAIFDGAEHAESGGDAVLEGDESTSTAVAPGGADDGAAD